MAASRSRTRRCRRGARARAAPGPFAQRPSGEGRPSRTASTASPQGGVRSLILDVDRTRNEPQHFAWRKQRVAFLHVVMEEDLEARELHRLGDLVIAI